MISCLKMYSVANFKETIKKRVLINYSCNPKVVERLTARVWQRKITAYVLVQAAAL